MKTKQVVGIAENTKKNKKITILQVADLVDLKVENDMEKVLNKLNSMEVGINSKIDALNTKYTVLMGMLSFLIIVITILSFLFGFKA